MGLPAEFIYMMKVFVKVINSGKVQSLAKCAGLRSDCDLKQLLSGAVCAPPPVVRFLLVTGFGMDANKTDLHLYTVSS